MKKLNMEHSDVSRMHTQKVMVSLFKNFRNDNVIYLNYFFHDVTHLFKLFFVDSVIHKFH